MAALELKLFGEFELRRAGGQAIDLPAQKERALLAVLALPPGAIHSRDKLASLLWSDRGDAQARDSLKHALYRLRQCLRPASPSPIVADRRSVRLDAAGLSSDVASFEQLLAVGGPDVLEQATTLFRGDLLEGIGVRDPAFEDWLLVERQRLRRLAEDALTNLIAQSMADGAPKRAEVAARRLLALDPLREAACRAMMQIHAEASQAPQALKLYEALRDRLHRELGVKPEPQTVQLYESIRQGQYKGATPSHALSQPDPDDPAKPPHPSLPSKPSIAVLAFQNLSDDPEQEYFADGMVEEIIIALSRFHGLFVIGRNSSFTYKGRAVDVKQVGRELGVRYVLEGTVRKHGYRVRITAQLIDTSTGGHIWADRFDGRLEDIFDLQDQVTASVAGAIAPKLEQAEIARVKRKPTESLDAYDYFLRGMASLHQGTKESIEEALRVLYGAIERDSDFASAHGMATWCYALRKWNGWTADHAQEAAECAHLARQAVTLAKDDAVALCTGGFALAFYVGDVLDGAACIDRALALNPNLATAWHFGGWVSVWLGEPEVAIKRVGRAMRLSPVDPFAFLAQGSIALAHFVAGRYDEALSWAQRSIRERPNFLPSIRIYAASCAMAGRQEEAQKAIARVRQLNPAFCVSDVKAVLPARPHDLARYEKALLKAGLPNK